MSQEFSAAVHDLGGTDEDLRMLADADFSGSDFEDSNAAGSGGDLHKDVAALWSQLSGDKSAPEAEPKAKESKKKETKQKDSRQKDVKQKDAKESRQGEPKPKIASDPKTEIKTETRPKHKEAKPAKPTQPQMSKKDRLAWEKYIESLSHPAALLIEDQDWSTMTSSASSTVVPTEIFEKVAAKSREMLTEENQMYFKSRAGDREYSSSLEFLKSGTFSDQLGTLSILATESPLHSVRFIESLVSKCEIKNRESACRALEVTKDLLVSHVLPSRRLRTFKDQPLSVGTSPAVLVSYAFEDFLKRLFFRLLQTVERLLADSVENIRQRTLNCVFDFFVAKPEQEANLLRLSLNKLGDPAGKVASLVKRRLMDALQQHPGMKLVVASAMAETLGRTVDYRARYYAVDTLSEFIFSNRDPELANKVIFIYLDLFERLLAEEKADEGRVEKAAAPKSKRRAPKRGKKGGIQQQHATVSELEQQQHARLVAKLFTGLNRAFPFSNLDASAFSKYTDTMYKMSHSPNVGTFIEALCFVYQLAKLGGTTDRYFRALYDSLLDPRLPHSAKLGKYVHLLLRSMAELSAPSETSRSTAFSKRMLQVALNLAEVGASASFIHVAGLVPHFAVLRESRETSGEDEGESKSEAAPAEGQSAEATDAAPAEPAEPTGRDEYDPKQRDPRYAGAEHSSAWEALLLQQHYHPTVALYARNLIEPTQGLAMPDIEQYSVNQFLTRWAYKKPKDKESTRGGSIFQPLPGFTDLNLGVRFAQRPKQDVPASMLDWKSKSRADVAPEERFMYDYFVQRPERKPKEAKKATDADGEEDNLDEDEISEAMSRAGPGDQGNVDVELDGLSDDEEDGDLDDELAKAFEGSDDDDGDDGDADDADDGDADLDGADLDDADLDGADLDGANFDDADFDDADMDGGLESAEGEPDDFTNFDREVEPEKKRKRKWAQYPTFLDADAFDEQQLEKRPKRD